MKRLRVAAVRMRFAPAVGGNLEKIRAAPAAVGGVARHPAFPEAVWRDREPPVSGIVGVENQRILAGVYRSARSGKRKTIQGGL